VDQILRSETGLALVSQYGRSRATAAIRDATGAARVAIRGGADTVPTIQDLCAIAQRELERASQPSLRPVFNLTGVVLHTNLGRAILADEAVEAAVATMRSPAALEYVIDAGARGERDDHIRDLLCHLTGAEDAIAVNNNAAALVLVLAALALGKETIVSRGELIEIGGSFRLPTIMESAGTILREVGTTNRTHARDYMDAIGPNTGLVMKVHRSNFAIQGFSKEQSLADLAAICSKTGIPLVNDSGSGTLVDMSAFGLPREPTVQEAIAGGSDLVTFSGDKLLGGPQAGLIVGRRDLVQRCARHPLKRALRLDKVRLAALEATLRRYQEPETVAQKLPTQRYLARQPSEIAEMARGLHETVAAWSGSEWIVKVVDCVGEIGSGALPLATLPSAGLTLKPVHAKGSELNAMAARLRRLPTPVIGRVSGGAIFLDLRCVDDLNALRDNFARDPERSGGSKIHD
jgi:L-seryl-tRNA(Ser) seleniumtransferase